MLLDLITPDDVAFIAQAVAISMLVGGLLLIAGLRINAMLRHAARLAEADRERRRRAAQRLNTAPRPGETLRNYSARLAAARARDADLTAIEPDERLARAARTSKAPIPPRASFESRPDLVLGDNPTHRRP